MPRHTLPTGRQSRRATIRQSVTLGAGLLLARGSVRATAQGTPAASPAAAASYAHPEALVDAGWVDAHRRDPGVLLVALMPSKTFEAAHLPASFRIDWPDLEVVDTSETGIADWESAIRERVGDLHIEPESDVVVYDDGSLFAARLWWVLRFLGHRRVRVLDGGLPAWRAAGLDIETGPVIMTMEKRPPYPSRADHDILARYDEVLAALDDPDVVIVDARTPDEHAEGHIPGAVNLAYTRNAAPEPPTRYKPAGELREIYEAIGVTPDRLVIPYCSTGVRSAVTAHALHLIGYERVALFTGSWQEWSSHPEAPVTRGDAP